MVLGLAFGLEHLVLLLLDDLLELALLGEYQLVVGRLLHELSLQASNGSTRRLPVALALYVFGCEPSDALLELLLLRQQAPRFILQVSILSARRGQIFLQLRDSRLVQLKLLTHRALVSAEFVDRACVHLDISEQALASTFHHIQLILQPLHLNSGISLGNAQLFDGVVLRLGLLLEHLELLGERLIVTQERALILLLVVYLLLHALDFAL